MQGQRSAMLGTKERPGSARTMSPERWRSRGVNRQRADRSFGDALSPSASASGSFRLQGRAEPSLALAQVHIDARVPASAGLVIDALAIGSQVALDRAFRRRRSGGGCGAEQDLLRVRRDAGRAEHDGLLVAMPPVPRGDERAGPKTGARLAGLGLIVGVRVANKCECPSVPHHPFLNVLAINGAARERATVAIRSGDAAGPRLVANVADEFIAGADAASPSAAFGVET